ncbi:hypothetical protein DFS34DRAFT_589811 [Phlyctochytrium arcticum]|nr:hypothetical protein DFS34DRAFT_589811 [Phlyctochytrium arcticum]
MEQNKSDNNTTTLHQPVASGSVPIAVTASRTAAQTQELFSGGGAVAGGQRVSPGNSNDIMAEDWPRTELYLRRMRDDVRDEHLAIRNELAVMMEKLEEIQALVYAGFRNLSRTEPSRSLAPTQPSNHVPVCAPLRNLVSTAPAGYVAPAQSSNDGTLHTPLDPTSPARKRKRRNTDRPQSPIPRIRYWFQAVRQWNYASPDLKVPLKDWIESERAKDSDTYSNRKIIAMEVEYMKGLEGFNALYSAGLPDAEGNAVKGVLYKPTRYLISEIRKRRVAEKREGTKTTEMVKQFLAERSGEETPDQPQ